MKKTIRIINTLIITVGCALFLFACDIFNFKDLKKPEEGKGTFRPVIESEASSRTILPPKTGLSSAGANYYTLNFTSTGKTPVDADRDNTTLSTTPIYLAAGTWDLTITAFTDALRNVAVARETFSGADAIEINAGEETLRTLKLKPISTGLGTGGFSWDIDFSGVLPTVTTATMTFTGTGTISPINLISQSSGTKNDLPVGYYRVVLNLSNGTGSATMMEVLHIYENMTSGPFEYTFEDKHFTATAPSTSYTVIFNKNGGTTEADPATKTVTSPATTIDSLPTPPSRTGGGGWTFVEWNTAANKSGSTFTASTPVSEDIEVFAIWKATVIFNKNGGTTEADPQTIDVITPATTVGTLPAEPTRTGYTFDSWNTESDGSGSPFTASTPVPGTIPVFAQWTGKPALSITFDDFDELAPTLSGGSALSLADPTTDVDLVVLDNPTQYDSIEWKIGSTTLVSSGTYGTLTLNSGTAPFNVKGTYIVTVIVEKDGVDYSSTVEIEVED